MKHVVQCPRRALAGGLIAAVLVALASGAGTYARTRRPRPDTRLPSLLDGCGDESRREVAAAGLRAPVRPPQSRFIHVAHDQKPAPVRISELPQPSVMYHRSGHCSLGKPIHLLSPSMNVQLKPFFSWLESLTV